MISQTLTKATHPHVHCTYLSSFRIPPSHSLNIIYFSQSSQFCATLFTSRYLRTITRMKFAKRTSRSEAELSIKMLWCYTLFKVLYFPARSSRTSTTGGHLSGFSLNYMKERGTVWEPRGPLSRWYI